MQCCALLWCDWLQAWLDVSTQSRAAVHKQPEGSNVCSSAMPRSSLALMAAGRRSSQLSCERCQPAGRPHAVCRGA